MNDHPDWNESYYFNFYDEKNDITAFMRIGGKPNRDEKSMFFFVIDGGKVAGMRGAEGYDGDVLSCNNLVFKENGDGSWHISYAGPVANPVEDPVKPFMLAMDVDWTPINPLMDYRECVDEAGARMASDVVSEHYEQFGSAKGTMSIGGREVSIEAYGDRDRSSGVRDWGSPEMWLWLNSIYDGRHGFNLSKVVTPQGAVDGGYFYVDGRNHAICHSDVELNYSDDGLPAGYVMTLESKEGREFSVEGRVKHAAMLPMEGSKGMLLVETISETVWNGVRGYGVAEFLVPRR